jgi:hypothetical protein
MPDRTFVILNSSVWKPYLNSPTPAEFRFEYVLVDIPLHVARRYLQLWDFLISFWLPAVILLQFLSAAFPYDH